MHVGTVGLSAGLVLALAGCGDTPKPYEPITDPTQVYFQLKLNYGAVNLSTASGYNTFQLTATPLNALSEPMTGLPTPTFTSDDTTLVTVSPSGLLTGLSSTTGGAVQVVASLTTSDNVKHTDTAFVTVIADPPPDVATFTIDPVPPDSAIWPMGGTLGDLYLAVWVAFAPTFRPTPALNEYVQATAPGGAVLPTSDWAVEYFSLDSSIVAIDRWTGNQDFISPGVVRVVARTVAYGVVRADTTEFAVTPALYNSMFLGAEGAPFLGAGGVIRQGGYIYMVNSYTSHRPVGLVFSGPGPVDISPSDTACVIATTNNSANFGFYSENACNVDMSMDTTDANSYRIRRFMVPGVYSFRDTLSGATGGQVTVLDSTTWGQ